MSDTRRISADKLRVYFLGSGLIAVPLLSRLLASELITLVGCGTQPDRPQGRKRKLTPTPVGQFCKENSFPVDKPNSANSSDFLEKLRSLQPDMILVFAFGQILKNKLLNLPQLGCVNVHASLLPKYRGASPINAAILAGDSVTGISVMKMARGLDSGPVYQSFEFALSGRENALELSKQLAELAAENVCESLRDIADGSLTPEEQDPGEVSYAGKITKADGMLSWDRPAVEIERMVRAYYPWPGAYFTLTNSRITRRITITQAAVVEANGHRAPSEIIQADKNAWIVACGSGALKIEKLVPEGKKEMTGTEFIRGCPMQPGILLHETDHCQSRESTDSDCIDS